MCVHILLVVLAYVTRIPLRCRWVRQTLRGHPLVLAGLTRVPRDWMTGRRSVGEVTIMAGQHHRMAYHSVSSVGAATSHAAHCVTRDFPRVLERTTTTKSAARHPQRLFPPLRLEVRCYTTATQNARMLCPPLTLTRALHVHRVLFLRHHRIQQLRRVLGE